MGEAAWKGGVRMSTYTTIQGDAWDLISWKVYGEEKYMRYLIEANWGYSDVLVFSAGVVLNVPDLPEETEEDVPFWREDDNVSDEIEDDDEDEEDEDW